MHNKNYKAMLAQALRRYSFKVSRTKLFLFAFTLIAVGFALGGLEGNDKDEVGLDIVSAHKVISLNLPKRDTTALITPAGMLADIVTLDADAPLSGEIWEEVTVRPGQSLGAIFKKQGFSAQALHYIMALNEQTKQLKKIRPGDLFEFQRYEDMSLKRMRYAVDEGNYLIVDLNGEQADASLEPREIITRVEETKGTIDSSLFMAGKKAGLNDGMVMKLANLFGWDIDFVLDIRKGDNFQLVYEKLYRDGEFLRDGNIIGASFVNQGERFQAIRFDIDGKPQYFAPDGRNMRKAFLRAPLNFSYISSSFNPKRFHPVLKRIKAHNGIDYRAPTGTPVYAAGDGKVIRSDYNKFNGHHVFIQHTNGIITKYLHFSKRSVKNGQRVKQGQVIGLVGSTGMSTASHLHYEFLVNGVHRNPRTVPLPKADPLSGEQLIAFQATAAPLLSQLSRLESADMYAKK